LEKPTRRHVQNSWGTHFGRRYEERLDSLRTKKKGKSVFMLRGGAKKKKKRGRGGGF